MMDVLLAVYLVGVAAMLVFSIWSVVGMVKDESFEIRHAIFAVLLTSVFWPALIAIVLFLALMTGDFFNE